jgi:hypothetical protein
VGEDAVVRVWEASPVTAEVARRRGLVSDVDALFARGLLRQEVLAALRKDPTLPDGDRAFALEVARAHSQNARAAKDTARKVIRAKPGG